MIDKLEKSEASLKTVTPTKGKPKMRREQWHIMIVDDFKDDRDMYGHYLTQKGYRVTLACDGQEALDKAFQSRPDLIVMDLWLPVIGGWEATRRLKADKRTSSTPIVILTARALVQAASLGCEGCLVKPCLPEVLLAEVNRILEKPEQTPAAITASADHRDPVS